MITVNGNVMFHTDHDNWGSRHRDWYDGHDGKNYDPLPIENNYWQQGDADSSKENVTGARQSPDQLAERGACRPCSHNAGLRRRSAILPAERFAKAAPPEPPSRVAAWAGKRHGVRYVEPVDRPGRIASRVVYGAIVRGSGGAHLGGRNSARTLT